MKIIHCTQCKQVFQSAVQRPSQQLLRNQYIDFHLGQRPQLTSDWVGNQYIDF